MEEKQISKEQIEKGKQILKENEDGDIGNIPLKRKTDYTKFAPRRVYNRKILRNMIKKQLGTNKIRNAWHQLRAEGRA